MDIVPLQVGCGSLQEPPVATFVVGDVRLHLVVLSLVGDQHAFNSGHLLDTDNCSSGLSLTFFERKDPQSS